MSDTGSDSGKRRIEWVRQLREERDGLRREQYEVGQILGQALCYPRYADDQENFPGTTDEDGVCVGEHIPATPAQEAAAKIGELTAELAQVRAERDRLRDQLTELAHNSLVVADELWETGGNRAADVIRLGEAAQAALDMPRKGRQ